MNRYTIRDFKYESGSPMARLQELENKVEDGEIVEVKHGYWSPCGACYTCSVCGGEVYVDEWAEDYDAIEDFELNYCSECGAKMDGERNIRL